MDKELEKYEKVKNMLTKKSLSDFGWALSNLFFNIVKTFGFIPPEYLSSGEILNFIKGEFGLTQTQRKQLEFLVGLLKRLDELEEEISTNYVKTNEFETYVLKCFDSIKYEQYEAKILALKNALINIVTGKISNNFEKEYFMNNLISFTDLHFALLSYFNNPEEHIKKAGIDLNTLKSQKGGEEREFQKVFQNVDFDLLKISLNELKQKGFISLDLSMWRTLSTRTVYDSLTTKYLTKLGKSFIDFCLDKE